MIKGFSKGSNTAVSKNFKANEFDCKCGKYCSTTLIDEGLVYYLQAIREHFGKAVKINSGYRCAEHNKNVGGATKSNHTKGQAADIKIDGVEPREVAKFAESIGVKGIGLYGTFVHIDTRTNKYFWIDGGASNLSTFGADTTTSSNATTNSSSTVYNKITVSLPTLRKGQVMKEIKIVQALLGVAADGVFGPKTETAVKEYQSKNNLEVDGIVGVNTWKSLL